MSKDADDRDRARGGLAVVRTFTFWTASSSAFVKQVVRLPLTMGFPSASVAPTSAAGPWHTAAVGLPVRKNYREENGQTQFATPHRLPPSRLKGHKRVDPPAPPCPPHSPSNPKLK